MKAPENPPVKTTTRDGVVSYLAYLHGGHNASPPLRCGRLGLQVDTEDDEAVARYFYHSITEDARKPLLREIETLKAKLYDLTAPQKSE